MYHEEEKIKVTSFGIRKEVHNRLKVFAVTRGTTLAALISSILEDWMKKQDAEKNSPAV